MSDLLFKGTSADFRLFADAGVTEGSYNKRAVEYLLAIGATGGSFNSLSRSATVQGLTGLEDWTPAEVTTNFWYDADDDTTVTLDGSSNVSDLADKSGNGNDLTQATASLRPPTALINDKTYLDARGSAYVLSNPSVSTGTGDSIISTVLEASSTAASANYSIIYEINDFLQHSLARYIDSGAQELRVTWDGNSIYSTSDNSYPNSGVSAHILICALEDGVGGRIRLNGTTILEVSDATQTASAVTGQLTLLDGNTFGNSAPFEGLFGELFQENNVATLANIEIREGYLAHKWGLTANLPESHPYKTTAPTV